MSLLKRAHILQDGCLADVEPKVLKGNLMEEIIENNVRCVELVLYISYIFPI